MTANPKNREYRPPKEHEEGDLVIEYTNLLHQYRNTDAKPVRAFLEKHADDPVFLKRANVLNRLFKLKAELVD